MTWGLVVVFVAVLRFPPLLTTGKSRISHNWHNCDEKRNYSGVIRKSLLFPNMLLDQTLVLYLAKTVALNVVRMTSMLYRRSQCCTDDLNVVWKISMLY